MKVSVNCKEFKNAVDRVLVVVPNNPAIKVLEAIHIVAHDDVITLSASDVARYIKVDIPAIIEEPGDAFILKDDIKKIYKLEGTVSLEANANGKFECTIKNEKKKSTVPTRDYNELDVSFPEECKSKVMEITGELLLEGLSNLSSCLLTDNTNACMCGYYFDGKNERIVALDGHRIGIMHLNDVFNDRNCEMIVRGNAYTHLKKIIKKKGEKISLFKNDKFAMFVGNDFVYWNKLIEASYFKIDHMFNFSNCDFEFNLNPEELGKLSKEYKTTIGTAERIPMYFCYDNDKEKMYSGVVMDNYLTSDIIENVKLNSTLRKSFIYGFNARYIVDAMNMFSDDVKVMGAYRIGHASKVQITPLILTDDKYTALILPVNAAPDNVNKFKAYINMA